MEGGMSSLETAMKASSSVASGTATNADPDQQTVRSNSVEQFYFPRPGQSLPGIPPFFGPLSSSLYLPNDNEAKVGNQFEPNPSQNTDWDPQAIVSNLTFLEQKIKQVKDVVQSMSNRENQVAGGSCELAAKQQLITADLTSIVIQLITTAGSLLPSMKNPLSSNPAVRQLSNTLGSPMGFGMIANQRPSVDRKTDIPDIGKASGYEELINSLNTTQDERDDLIKCPNPCGGEGSEPTPMEDLDVKESDDGEHEGENLPPGSYVVLQLEKEEI